MSKTFLEALTSVGKNLQSGVVQLKETKADKIKYKGYKGVTTYCGNPTQNDTVLSAFQTAKNDGFTGAVLVIELQTDLTELTVTYSNQISALTNLAPQIKDLGFKSVGYKIHLTRTAGTWTSLTAEQKKTWMTVYKDAVLAIAEIAEQYNAEFLVISNENPYMTNDTELIETWTTFTNDVRTIYSGKISHSMTYEQSFDFPLYDIEDIICINSYPMMSMNPDATIEECLYSDDMISQINQWKTLHEVHGKEIFITEFGCMPYKGRLASPGYFSTTTTDYDENTQSVFFAAFIQQLNECDFISGAYIWEIGYSFTPLGKVAEETIKEVWSL